MLANHFKKLLQGNLFIKFWAYIMNITEGLDGLDMGWEVSKSECNGKIKMYHVNGSPIQQECVVEYEKGNYVTRSMSRNVGVRSTLDIRTRESSMTKNGGISEVPDGGARI